MFGTFPGMVTSLSNDESKNVKSVQDDHAPEANKPVGTTGKVFLFN